MPPTPVVPDLATPRVHRRLCLFGLLGLLPGFARAQGAVRLALSDAQHTYGALIQAVFEDAGVALDLGYYPPPRALLMFQRGLVDAEAFRVAGVIQRHLPKDVVRVGPLAYGRVRWFARMDSIWTESPRTELLRGLRLVYARGHLAAQDWLADQQLEAPAVAQLDSAFQMLVNGRADLALTDELLGQQLLRQMGLATQVRPLGAAVVVEPAYLVLSGATARRFPRIVVTFDQWLHSGRWRQGIRAVNRRYGMPEDTGLPPELLR